VKTKEEEELSAEILDRLVEIMRHFHCEEPGEFEKLLRLRKDSILRLFQGKSVNLQGNAIRILGRAGIRREFITQGKGSMLSDTCDFGRLEIMKRHAAHLLKVIFSLEQSLSATGIPPHVTDAQEDSITIDEELINLLLEALGDKTSRERLLQFIRTEAANRGRRIPEGLI
jgi:hypothetical protein